MLSSALEHYRRQQRITAAGLVQARKARGQGVIQVARSVMAFQIIAARDAALGIEEMLAEQGIDISPDAQVVPESVAGTSSSGLSLPGLFEQARTDHAFDLMVATQLQDAARVVASMGVAVRDQVGYVRMLNPPSCSRCAVLAGKWFKWNQGFQRHPRCDCRHVPARETNWRGLTTNPNDYFDSLPTSADLATAHPDLTVQMRQEAGLFSQEDIFTKAGAQAIRDGANVGQVVNARSGMSTAQIDTLTGRSSGRLQKVDAYGQKVYATTEGTTRRGVAYKALNQRFQNPDARTPGERYFRTTGVRLMPESIYALAKDRPDAIRLLKLHGFVI